MKRRTLEFVALTAICCQVLSCAAKQTTVTSQKQANWSEAAPEAITAAMPEEEKKINAQTYFAAARLYEQQKAYQQAILQYRQALALEPENVAALNRTGMIYARIGRHNEAERMMLRAVELQPDSALLRNNIGFVYVGQKRWADAEAEFRNAIKLKPDFHRAHINLGMVLSKLDRYDDALRAFLDVLPEADAYYNLGLMLRARHRHLEAANAFQLALDINPGFTAAQTQLAQLQPRLRLIESLEPKSNRANWQTQSGRERGSRPAAPAVVAEKPIETMLPAIEAEPVPIEMEMTAAEQNEITEPQPMKKSEPIQEAEPIAITKSAPQPATETHVDPIPASEPVQTTKAMPEPETIEILTINEPDPEPAQTTIADRPVEIETASRIEERQAGDATIAEDVPSSEAEAEAETASIISEPSPVPVEVVVVEEMIEDHSAQKTAPEPTEIAVAEQPEPMQDEVTTPDTVEPVARQNEAEEIETLPVMEIVETREIAQSNGTNEMGKPAITEPIVEAPIIENEPIAEPDSIEQEAEQIPAEMIMLADLGDDDGDAPAEIAQPVEKPAPVAMKEPMTIEKPADEQIEALAIKSEEPGAKVADAEMTNQEVGSAQAMAEPEAIEILPVEPIEEKAIADKSPATPVMPAMLSGPAANAQAPMKPKRDVMFLTIDEPARDTKKAEKAPLKVKTRTNAKKSEVIEAESISVTSEPEVIAVDAGEEKESDE